MKLPASNKTTRFVKPHVKKGFYPAVLLSVEPYIDKTTGQAKVGKWGKQLIMEFAIYKANEDGAPVEPMKFVPVLENPTELNDVVIAKFVYHEYRNKQTGEFQTAITPNSAVTKIFQALGWEFSEEGIDPDEFVGHWVEALIDDYEYIDGDEKKIASTIGDINPYKGPTIGEVRKVEKKEPKSVERQVKHASVPKVPEKSVQSGPESPEVKALRDKISGLKELHKEGHLTAEGLRMATEQIETQIEELLRKK